MLNNKTWMRFALLALLGTTLSLYAIGCGDDSSSSAGDGDGDTSGDGDGDGDGDSSASCADSVYPALSDACKTCICTEDEANASKCDEACWNLVDCAATTCGGDSACALMKCTAYLAGSALPNATAVGPAVTTCATECTPDFVMTPDADAGADAGI